MRFDRTGLVQSGVSAARTLESLTGFSPPTGGDGSIGQETPIKLASLQAGMPNPGPNSRGFHAPPDPTSGNTD